MVWTENSNKINLFRISQNACRRVRQELVVKQGIEHRRQGKGLKNELWNCNSITQKTVRVTPSSDAFIHLILCSAFQAISSQQSQDSTIASLSRAFSVPLLPKLLTFHGRHNKSINRRKQFPSIVNVPQINSREAAHVLSSTWV